MLEGATAFERSQQISGIRCCANAEVRYDEMQTYALPTASAVMARYGSIIFLDRPVHDGDLFSRRHPAMTRLNRAKIFAPFAALVGFDERVRRKEITYVPKVELDADEKWELNRRLLILHERTANSKLARMNAIDIRVEYYAVCTDRENDAYMEKGQYLTVTGRLVKADPHRQELTLIVDGVKMVIRFSDIYQLSELIQDSGTY